MCPDFTPTTRMPSANGNAALQALLRNQSQTTRAPRLSVASQSPASQSHDALRAQLSTVSGPIVIVTRVTLLFTSYVISTLQAGLHGDSRYHWKLYH